MAIQIHMTESAPQKSMDPNKISCFKAYKSHKILKIQSNVTKGLYLLQYFCKFTLEHFFHASKGLQPEIFELRFFINRQAQDMNKPYLGKNNSDVDPHRFQCGSGSSIFCQCGSRSRVILTSWRDQKIFRLISNSFLNFSHVKFF